MQGQLQATVGWSLRFAAVLTAFFMVAGVAWAQEDPDDEPPFDLDAADVSSETGQLLQQGMTYYTQEQYQSASLLFFRIITDPDASDPVLFRAEYELAKTLFRLRLYYGSLFYFDGIVSMGPDHPYFVYSYPWLLRLNRRLPGEPHMTERLSQYADYFPDQIAEKYRDAMAYHIGRYFYSRGYLDEGLRFLSYVSEASPRFGEAQFLSGVAYIQDYDGQAAIDSFSQVIQHVLDIERTDDNKRLGELAVLSMARTLYSTRDYERAINYYDQVPASSKYWLEALFERSWALFQQEEYNLSLGNLHSLNSPFFDDEFFPEAMILTAVIFFRNCNFEAVRETVEEFQIAYEPLLDQLEEMTSIYTADSEYYDLILSLEREQEQEFSPQLQRILNTVLSDRVVQDSLAFVNELDRQLESVESAEAGWLNTGLADEILTETGLARSVGVGRAGENARVRIRRARDELRDLRGQSQALLVETDLAEQSVIDEALRSELSRGGGLEPPGVDSQHLLWHFAGEYWRDELGHYWYALRSRCDEMGL